MPLYLPIDEADAFHLRVVLESYISDLRMEISSTDRQEYREMLREREDALRRTLAFLEQSDASPSLNA